MKRNRAFPMPSIPVGASASATAVASVPSPVPPSQVGAAARHAQLARQRRTVMLIAGIFLLPSILGFLLYSAGPIAFGLYISFTKYVGFGSPEWTGLSNYVFLLHDTAFWRALLVTFLMAVFVVPLGIILPLALALLLNEDFPLQGLLRVIFFLPSAVPWVAAALLFKDMFGTAGIINEGLKLLHIAPQNWLYGTTSELIGPLFWLIVIITLWKGYGMNMLIYLAGLQAIPNELYEAAMLDGAGPWQRFRSVTVPALAPVTFFVLITSMIGALQIFTPVYLLGAATTVNGASTGAGVTTVSVYAYQTAFSGGYYGYGSAILWGMFIIMFAFTLIQFRILLRGTRRKEVLA